MIGLRHVAIRTRDLDRSRRFYEAGLGLRFIGYRASGRAIDLSDGAVNVTLLPYDRPPRGALEEGTEFIHLGFLVEDVAASYRRLVEQGAPIVRDDVNERRVPDPAGVPNRSFKVLDPDGNVVDVSGAANEWQIAPL